MAKSFDPAVKREKIHWMQGRKQKHIFEEWKKVATIGTNVLYAGELHQVESHAMLDIHKEAAVFLSGTHGPVSLRLLYLAADPGIDSPWFPRQATAPGGQEEKFPQGNLFEGSSGSG